MSKSKPKWLVVASQHLAAASIITTHNGHMYDAAIAINMADINCLEFADLIEQLINTHTDASTYSREAKFTMNRVVIHKFSGGTCSIIYNNCRVEYHGYIGRLIGLPETIRKSYAKSIKAITAKYKDI